VNTGASGAGLPAGHRPHQRPVARGLPQSNRSMRNSVAWVKDVLEQESAFAAGPFLTGRSYQFTADVVAVGHMTGLSSRAFVFDTSEGTPRIVYRQELTHLAGRSPGGPPDPGTRKENDDGPAQSEPIQANARNSLLGLGLRGSRLEASWSGGQRFVERTSGFLRHCRWSC